MKNRITGKGQWKLHLQRGAEGTRNVEARPKSRSSFEVRLRYSILLGVDRGYGNVIPIYFLSNIFRYFLPTFQ